MIVSSPTRVVALTPSERNVGKNDDPRIQIHEPKLDTRPNDGT